MVRRQTWWVVGVMVVVAVAALTWWYQSTRPTYPEINSPRPTLGPADAKILLEEFSDFECPACKAAQPTVKDILATFGDRLSFHYRHYPLIQVHTQAFRAAQAAECANDQGKFWEYHDKLFESQPALSRNDLITYARDLKLDVDGPQGFIACLDSRAKSSLVRSDVAEGDKRGVNSTPSFFLNGDKVADWSQLKELIQAKLIGG